MYSSTRKGTEGCMVAIGRGLVRSGTLTECQRGLATVLDGVPWLDGKSRKDILTESMKVARRGLLQKKVGLPTFLSSNLYDVMKAWNRAYKRLWVRTKGTQVRTGMKLQRDREDPVVFYLVSAHQKPQKAHEPLQGKLLVDRYWRTVLDGDARLALVERFVKARKVRTVQWAMGAPHYLISRPNCKHLLYPVRTYDVLNMPITDIRAKYLPRKTGVHRPLTEAQRTQAYHDLRLAVYDKVAKLVGLNSAVK